MKNFGLIKTKIETLLTESYKKKTFKSELKMFRKLVLEDDNVKKLFYIYDNLSKPQNLCEETSKMIIDESVKMVNNISRKANLKKITEWIKDIKVENQYKDIDNLFTNDVKNIKTIVESKQNIIKLLKEDIKTKQEIINLPLKTMLGIANKSMSELVGELNEEESKEFDSIVSLNRENIEEKFNELKTEISSKLETILFEQTDVDMVKTINDTIEKVKNEYPSSLTYYKLLKLKETI